MIACFSSTDSESHPFLRNSRSFTRRILPEGLDAVWMQFHTPKYNPSPFRDFLNEDDSTSEPFVVCHALSNILLDFAPFDIERYWISRSDAVLKNHCNKRINQWSGSCDEDHMPNASGSSVALPSSTIPTTATSLTSSCFRSRSSSSGKFHWTLDVPFCVKMPYLQVLPILRLILDCIRKRLSNQTNLIAIILDELYRLFIKWDYGHNPAFEGHTSLTLSRM